MNQGLYEADLSMSMLLSKHLVYGRAGYWYGKMSFGHNYCTKSIVCSIVHSTVPVHFPVRDTLIEKNAK